MEVLQKYPTSTLLTFYHSVFLHVILLLSFAIANEAFLGSETDRIALLKFKESISNDPYGVLSSWNDSFHFCEWPGIACSSRQQRTTALNLGSYGLRGTLNALHRKPLLLEDHQPRTQQLLRGDSFASWSFVQAKAIKT